LVGYLVAWAVVAGEPFCGLRRRCYFLVLSDGRPSKRADITWAATLAGRAGSGWLLASDSWLRT